MLERNDAISNRCLKDERFHPTLHPRPPVINDTVDLTDLVLPVADANRDSITLPFVNARELFDCSYDEDDRTIIESHGIDGELFTALAVDVLPLAFDDIFEIRHETVRLGGIAHDAAISNKVALERATQRH